MSEREARRPNKWAVYAVVGIGVLMATLDSSIVNISLPTIARSFGRPLGGTLSWVVIAYLIVIVSLLLTGGRLGDMLGRKRVWQSGLAIFAASSAACGIAPTLGALIACRALQGVGAALVMSSSPALLTSAFPAAERGRALGMNALTVAIGVSLGPPLGGIITERMSWRWIFFLNVPLGLLGVALAAWILPAGERKPSRFDLGGALAIAIGLGSMTFALSFGHQLGWRSPTILAGFVLSVAALSWFWRHEARHPAPLVDLSLFRHRVFASAFVSLVLSFLAMFGVAFLTPFYLENLRGLSVEVSGRWMMAYPLTIALVAPIAGALSDKVGSRLLAPIGLCTAATSLFLLGSVRASTPLLQVGACLSLGGLAQALFQPANNSALLGAAPPHRQGVAGGLLATGRVLGQSLSAALTGAVFAGRGAGEAGYRSALWVCASIALLGAGVALIRRR